MMSILPLTPNLRDYRGSKENLRRKNAEYNAMAHRVAEHVNRRIADNPNKIQQYMFANIAHDLGFTTDQVRAAISDGGYNGRTIGVTEDDRKELTLYLSKPPRAMIRTLDQAMVALNTLADIRRTALRSLIPPERVALSEWIEGNIKLPEGVSALPGPVRLWPYQREMADAISDPAIERVTLVKPVRVGFTTLLTGAIASFVANEPSPILALLPTEADCRDYVVSDIEPIFLASPELRGLLSVDTEEGERNTLLSKRSPGGSLKVVAARAPRNLRRHTARVLIVDEADACETGIEGNPIRLAERRTL
jgi:hypothetical protein